MRRALSLLASLALATLMLGAATGGAAAGGADKVTICHMPGTPAQGTLEVATAALDAHLAHGDYTGACAGGDTGAACDAFNNVSFDADYIGTNVGVGTYDLLFNGDEEVFINATRGDATPFTIVVAYYFGVLGENPVSVWPYTYTGSVKGDGIFSVDLALPDAFYTDGVDNAANGYLGAWGSTLEDPATGTRQIHAVAWSTSDEGQATWTVSCVRTGQYPS